MTSEEKAAQDAMKQIVNRFFEGNDKALRSINSVVKTLKLLGAKRISVSLSITTNAGNKFNTSTKLFDEKDS